MPTRDFVYLNQRSQGCGIACAAMIAGTSYEMARQSFISVTLDRGMDIYSFINVLQDCGDGTIVEDEPDAKIKTKSTTKKEFQRLCEKRITKLGTSLLISLVYKPKKGRADGHFVLYDAKTGKILDPERYIDKPISVKKFISQYFKHTKFIEFHKIK